ncbi:MAG: outer membrane lipoprotein-sorting protein [Spirochaetes bacterium]|nr:outer membrane lipoprotein-sorting protein [Spirochaetota bacterium]
MRILLASALALATIALPAVAEGTLDAAAILDRMDEALNFPEGTMVVSLEDRKPDGSSRILRAKVAYALDSGTLAEFIAPEREKGKRVLMIGDAMWMSVPGVSRAVRLSGKASFLGTSLTNDDLLNFDKADDYTGRIASETSAGWTLELEARSRSRPYQRIVVTVDREFLPVLMVLYSLSGREAKRMEYSDPVDFGGKRRPSRIAVTDAMERDRSTVVTFESIVEGKVDRSRLSPAGFMK